MGPVFTISSWVLTTIVLFVTLNRGLANAVNYKKVGDKIVLSPGSVTAPITSITWKYNSNLAVEWFGGGEPDFYPKFKGRSELKTETGELIIPNPTPEYSGIYTPEISNRVLNPTEFKFISGVPKPTVSENCDDEKCVFTCDANTTDSEPVTYTWWSGNVKKSETKELIVTKEETEPSFICELKNPVSSERSTEVLNPFTSSPTPPPLNTQNDSNSLNGWIVFLVLVLVLVLAAVTGVFIYKRRTGRYPPQLSTLPCFKKNDVAATEVPPDSGSEKEKLISGTNGEAQLDHINETETSHPPPKPARQSDSVSGSSRQPDTTSETEEKEGAPTKHQSSDPLSGGEGTTLQDKNDDESTGIKAENLSQRTGDKRGADQTGATSETEETPGGPADDSSSPDPLSGKQGTSEEDQKNDKSKGEKPSAKTEDEEAPPYSPPPPPSGGDQESHQTETPAVSPEPNKDKPAETTEVDKTPDQSDATSETEEEQGAPADPPSPPPSGTSDQPDAALETQGVTAKHQPSGSSSGSSDQPEEETFHSHAEVQPSSFSLETVNETEPSSEKSEDKQPPGSPSGPSHHPGKQGTTTTEEKNDESKAETTEVDQTPDHSNATSKTPDNQGGPTSQEESGSSSGASVHSDHENIDIKL